MHTAPIIKCLRPFELLIEILEMVMNQSSRWRDFIICCAGKGSRIYIEVAESSRGRFLQCCVIDLCFRGAKSRSSSIELLNLVHSLRASGTKQHTPRTRESVLINWKYCQTRFVVCAERASEQYLDSQPCI